ncbi:DUF4350 domain-containing protein [Chitinophaga silvatica]|uniref:DUF4350 domain-containing protein n=1 Tax=Chitinophaga silvatica TaxID=2282649 RepID=A0A3E1Y7H6_9BACT|nr:DUF4350 domain-containing protein [Chitinophaga silvatica]RFS20996.1 DUF4350 domain-containing protein [Chitinophaga silvatica]
MKVKEHKPEPQPADLSEATFGQRDKRAGGSYAAFKLLPSLFKTNPQVVTKPFPQTIDKNRIASYGYGAYIIVADQLFLNPTEVSAMIKYVRNGNDIFIAVNDPGNLLETELGFSLVGSINSNPDKTSFTQRFLDRKNGIDTSFTYDGLLTDNYFHDIDTTTTTILGYSGKSHANFIKVSKENGNVYLLLNPYLFTNYVLLQKKNIAALEIPLSYLGAYSNVFWDDYYHNLKATKYDNNFSEWKVLLRYPTMRWALWLLLALALIYLLVESKRRQRIIPKIPQLTNNSVEFVDAMGQLYFQQHNNYNLAQKMIVHLLEHIRLHFYINTNALNDDFINALTRKTALPAPTVKGLFDLIFTIQINQQASDEELMELYQQIQSFYLNAK